MGVGGGAGLCASGVVAVALVAGSAGLGSGVANRTAGHVASPCVERSVLDWCLNDRGGERERDGRNQEEEAGDELHGGEDLGLRARVLDRLSW